ncbi:MAG TPA: putative glycoside hydrolase [Candidatus Dormibacteraeota bacterium]|nr:putative glycoside hydrolase [Candidatus Dormibacteraeota bacterium]
MRLSSVRIITGVSCLLFAGAAWRLGPRSTNFTAAAQTAKPAVATQAAPQLKPVSVTTAKTSIPDPKPVAAPGTEIYTAKRGEAIPTIAHRYLSKTSYLTSSELAAAIRSVNHKSDSSNILKANENVIIPGILSAPINEKTIPIAKDFEVRAIYLTGYMAGSDHGLRTIRHWREVGGNAVVFDIKDSDGSVTIAFEHPLLGKHDVYIHDVPKLVHFLHQQNMHAIARIAIFRDERLVVNHPELAVQSRKNKTAWRENGKLVWTDPSNPQVQDYDIALAKHVAQLGVDEIQFDYVRFPAEGDQKDAAFVFQKDQPEPAADASSDNATCGEGRSARPADAKQGGASTTAEAKQPETATPQASTDAPNAAAAPGQKNAAHGASRRVAAKNGAKSHKDGTTACSMKPRGPQRTDVIASFLKKAYSELHPTGVLLSLDVFGVMAWQRQIDLSHTGQDIVQMARYCDVLSPMIYPSHFFGMDGIAHPGDEPAHFIGESMDRFELITKGSGVVIRPWLQAFHWRTKTYSPEYIKIQVETAKTKGGIGFLFWNAANDYSKPFTAMPEMKSANYKEGSKDNPKYFRGDELPAATVQAALTTAK